jgi:hypothetical protein
MKIKVKDILTIYISPDHNEKYHKRKLHMDSLLQKLKFTHVIHYKSNTENYPFCLNSAYIDIFVNYKPPFLLLEDDIDCDIDTFPEEIDIPDSTDAFYLGLSCSGGHQIYNYDEGVSSFIQISDPIVKIRNMLSAHAVIYMNQKYMMHIRNLLISNPNYYNDVLISQIQNQYNIYTFNKYVFYQSKDFDGHEQATRITIKSEQLDDVSKYTCCYVSAFLNFYNKSEFDLETEYFTYFHKLVILEVPIILFLDTSLKNYANTLLDSYKNIKIIFFDKQELLFGTISQLPMHKNTDKDTKEYIQFMNNKILFMERAMNSNLFTTNHYAWIDFRIFHIFKNNTRVSQKLLDLTKRKYTKSAYFPGAIHYNRCELNEINWRFLGGFFILDRDNIVKLKNETIKIFSSINMLTWEVNIWSILESLKLFDFGWYLADHNDSMLDAFQMNRSHDRYN